MIVLTRSHLILHSVFVKPTDRVLSTVHKCVGGLIILDMSNKTRMIWFCGLLPQEKSITNQFQMRQTSLHTDTTLDFTQEARSRTN